MNKQRKIKKAIDHIIGEAGLERIEESIKKGSFKDLQKSHDSVHEFMYLVQLVLE